MKTPTVPRMWQRSTPTLMTLSVQSSYAIERSRDGTRFLAERVRDSRMATESHREYRHRADECERLAKMANNTEVRLTLLYLGKRWTNFAWHAQAKPEPSHTSAAPHYSSI